MITYHVRTESEFDPNKVRPVYSTTGYKFHGYGEWPTHPKGGVWTCEDPNIWYETIGRWSSDVSVWEIEIEDTTRILTIDTPEDAKAFIELFGYGPTAKHGIDWFKVMEYYDAFSISNAVIFNNGEWEWVSWSAETLLILNTDVIISFKRIGR